MKSKKSNGSNRPSFLSSSRERYFTVFLSLAALALAITSFVSTGPRVLSSHPLDGDTNISVNITSITANGLFVPEDAGLKGGVDNNTLTNATVRLLKVDGETQTEVKGVVQGTAGGDAIGFTPGAPLAPYTSYRFVITQGVKSHSGAGFAPFEATFTTGPAAKANGSTAVAFSKVPIPGTQGRKYTSLVFGPDGKLYALRLDGVIERFKVDPQDGMLRGQQEIRALVHKYGERTAIGLAFDPSSTADSLVAWVSHSSPGLGLAPEFDGNISRLTGPGLGHEQLVVTHLPRSNDDHLGNSLAFGPDSALYFSQGSNSSMGDYDSFWKRAESLLSAAVLRLDMHKLRPVALPLDVRTTSDQHLINRAPAGSVRMADGTYNPYGAESPLTVYASGVRNAYDLVWHSNGQLYMPANGSAAGGNSPASVPGTRRPDGSLYSGPEVPAVSGLQTWRYRWSIRRLLRFLRPVIPQTVQRDWLFRVNPHKPVGYFGHPNPLRGEYVAGRGQVDNPKYPATLGPDSNYRGAAFDFGLHKSPNGALEYKSGAFDGALRGRILVCRFSGGGDIIVLEPGSTEKIPTMGPDDSAYDIVYAATGAGGIPGLAGFANPLDIVEDLATGNLYVSEFNWFDTPGKAAQISLLRVEETPDLE